MITYHVLSVPVNHPRNRVQKKNGLWHVWLAGRWTAAYGSWDNAIRCATSGVVWR